MNPVVVNIMQEVVDKVSEKKLSYLQSLRNTVTGVRFDYGHPADIIRELVQRTATNEFRVTKYPLIGLFLDIPQTRGKSVNSIAVRLNGFIAIDTLPKYTPKERTQQSFVPFLHPIYDEFIKQLLKHPGIVTPDNRVIPHTYVERYQWGKGGLEYYENGKKDVFNDYMDAIEFINMELEFNLIC